ncbi:surface-adhesin E family protein [Acinetobacter lactucae]|uniref:surface-adhesin E family protein n=1 Tax=Acinetobacter lactucae TaxID=1785128 RepID=UPI0034D1F82A
MKKLSLSVFALMSSTLTWSGIYEDFKKDFPTYSEEKKQTVINNVKKLGWTPTGKDQQQAKTTYLNYEYIYPIGPSTVGVWEKQVVNIDLEKDSLSVNDFQMVKSIYYCDKRKQRLVSITNYDHKTGKSSKSADFKDMNVYTDILPDTVGNTVMQYACALNVLKSY